MSSTLKMGKDGGEPTVGAWYLAGGCTIENSLAATYWICILGALLSYLCFLSRLQNFLFSIVFSFSVSSVTTRDKLAHVWDLYSLYCVLFSDFLNLHFTQMDRRLWISPLIYFCLLPQKHFPELEDSSCQPLREFEATKALALLRFARARSGCHSDADINL